jgi:hypothetical protein
MPRHRDGDDGAVYSGYFVGSFGFFTFFGGGSGASLAGLKDEPLAAGRASPLLPHRLFGRLQLTSTFRAANGHFHRFPWWSERIPIRFAQNKAGWSQ